MLGSKFRRLGLIPLLALCACTPSSDPSSSEEVAAIPATEAASDTPESSQNKELATDDTLGLPPREARKPDYIRPDANWREYLTPLIAKEDAHWSETYEELCIRDYFQDRRDGVFLDVGCYLPRKNSTTYYLEHNLGWTGIGIDALEKFREGWEQWRPNSRFFAYAITNHDGDTLTFYEHGPISSLDEEHAEQTGTEATEIQVSTITLNTLLDRESVTKIDFVSMDIEGAEADALSGFDIRRFSPELVCIERNPPEKDEFLLKYFGENGYELIEQYQHIDKVNWYFKRSAPSAN